MTIRLGLAMSLVAVVVRSADHPFASPEEWRFDAGDWHFVEGGLTQKNPRIIPHAFWPEHAYGDGGLRVRFRAAAEGDGVKAAGLILRSPDSATGYHIHYDTRNDQIIVLRRQFGRRRVELARRRGVVMDTGTWYTAETRVIGGRLEVKLDGKTILTIEDPEPLAPGVMGLYTSQGQVDFADLVIDGTVVDLEQPWRMRMLYDVPMDQKGAVIDWVKPICVEPGRYIGWPTVCRRRNGELVAIFSGDRSQHVCPWGKVQVVRSLDQGDTWSEPETLCNTPLDDRDAGIIETRQGTLVVNWFTSLAFAEAGYQPWLKKLEPAEILLEWQRHAEKLTPEIRDRWLGSWTRRGLDGGTTWEAPVRHLGSAPHGGIELADGRLLFVGRAMQDDKRIMSVEESRDDGASWQLIGRVPPNPDDNLNEYYEPHVVETHDGTLVAMFRYHYHEKGNGRRREDMCFLRQAESRDGGKTWTPCHTTPMQGYPPHLVCLSNGDLVCVYGRRRPPFGEYACRSRDGGKTWDIENEVRLAAATGGDLGYPASTELADGSILTVYYQIAREGEKTCLMGTRWRLKN